MKDRMNIAREFNLWREFIEQELKCYPSFCIENFICFLETDGRKWIEKIKPKQRISILAYKKKQYAEVQYLLPKEAV